VDIIFRETRLSELSYWPFVYVLWTLFLNCRNMCICSPNFWASFSMVKLKKIFVHTYIPTYIHTYIHPYIHTYTDGFGYILGDFFTNSSGHPDYFVTHNLNFCHINLYHSHMYIHLPQCNRGYLVKLFHHSPTCTDSFINNFTPLLIWTNAISQKVN
jgi:hypothetical protein